MLKKSNLVNALLLTGALAVPGGTWADTAPVKQNVSISQQNGKVTCKVEDSFGPVVGASIVVKGTTNGNVSDSNGRLFWRV